MKRIKENELENIFKLFSSKNIKIEIDGALKQVNILNDFNIVFLGKSEINIFDKNNNIIINLGFIEEIYLLEKNKLKFLTENGLEILIIFL